MGRYGRGDGGETDLFGGWRVLKSDLRVECYGEIDELSSVIGVCRALLGERHKDIDQLLRSIQEALFRIGAELASKEPKELGLELVGEKDLALLDSHVEKIETSLPQLRHFIYPGGALAGATLHLARAVARRVERRVVALSRRENVNPMILTYLNRLSTLLYHLARYINAQEGVSEDIWPGRGLK